MVVGSRLLHNESTWDFVRRRSFKDIPVAERGQQLEFMLVSIEGEKRTSTIHLYGVTRSGDSVHCAVTGFHHYFWVELPAQFFAHELAETRRLWNMAIRATRKWNDSVDAIADLTIEKRENVFFYKGAASCLSDYLKVTLSRPKDNYEVRNFFASTDKKDLPHGRSCGALTMFEEVGVDYAARFMCDNNVVGFGWIVATRYELNRQRSSSSPSRVTWDVSAQVSQVRCYTPDDGERYSVIAPLRTLDFDIECCATTRQFPKPNRDPVIMIGVQVWESGSGGKRAILDAMLYTGTTDPIVEDASGVNGVVEIVMAEYSTEEALLLGFSALLRAVDYDVSRAFNGRLFDWQYLFDRAKSLSIDEQFCDFGRREGLAAVCGEENTFKSNARGQRSYRDAEVPGRADFDICDVARREEKLRSYRLNYLCMEFLKDASGNAMTKEDVHHSMIPVLYRGSSSDRNRLARYCRRDTLLCRLLDEKRMYLVRYIEQARVCRVTLDDLIRRGQQVKVLSQLLALAREFNFILPLKRISTNYAPEGKYDGAVVFDPIVGYHDEPIVCLDFASLYSSELISENMDYSTLLEAAPTNLAPEDYFLNDEGKYFVRPNLRKGLLCVLLDRLLTARKVAKNDVKVAKNAAKALTAAGDLVGAAAKLYEADVLDARQTALKLSANSAYGFCGVKLEEGGLLPCFELAEGTTSCGRRDILAVRAWVVAHYQHAQIVYGDSVTGDTPVIVRRSTGVIDIVRCDELLLDAVWESDSASGKETVRSPALEVWSDEGFQPVKRFIRHRCHKPIYRVTTPTGVVDATSDHSLLRPDGTEVSPQDVTVGSCLLHSATMPPMDWSHTPQLTYLTAYCYGVFMANDSRDYDDNNTNADAKKILYNSAGERIVPSVVLNAHDVCLKKAFCDGYRSFICPDDGDIIRRYSVIGKQAAIGLWLVHEAIGYTVSLGTRSDQPNRFNITVTLDAEIQLYKDPHVVKKVELLHESYDGYVYDFETENHHFHVGPGRLVVHNTDSIMVKPGRDHGVVTVKDAMDWMFRVAGEINADLFVKRVPMKLAPEKVMYPAVFLAKKRYVSGYYETNPLKPDKVYYRGIESVRRDACELLSECIEQCCTRIFIERDIDGAVAHAKTIIEDLYLNRVDLHKLLMSKNLSHDVADYKAPQMHSILAAKMAKRDPSSAPVVGDRVSFIVVGDGTKQVRELAEDPLYVLERQIPINVDYYINNQLMEPLKRLFVPIIGERRTAEIFHGEHTRKRIRPLESTAKAPRGSIMSFAIVKRSCAECSDAYDPAVHKHPSLCPKCIAVFGADAQAAKQIKLDDLKVRYDAQFAICQACQGSDRDPVLCMERDCPQLYRRKALEFAYKRASSDIEDMCRLE
jgi:DNA polymerase elongation subunit (family B)